MNAAVEKGNIIPVATGSTVPVRDEHSIGTILIQARRLTPDDAERIMRLQRQQGLLFGDAAIQLGLLTKADIEFALARQFDCPYLMRGESKISESVVAAYAPFGPQAQVLGALRSQLMLRWFDGGPDHKALAIVSAERSEGRSFIAANLAVSFSQLGQKTLLIDADMRNPSQHNLFGVDIGGSLSEVLSGRAGPATIKHVSGLPNLWVFTAGAPPPNSLELLARPLRAQDIPEHVPEQYEYQNQQERRREHKEQARYERQSQQRARAHRNHGYRSSETKAQHHPQCDGSE